MPELMGIGLSSIQKPNTHHWFEETLKDISQIVVLPRLDNDEDDHDPLLMVLPPG